MIKVITGIRRYGKSYIMRLIKEEIEKTGVPEKDLVFLDLDKKGNKKY
ncbi:MAG: AAA family ATPase [Eubacteriales bacterium]|nr:AAA family ATPase [Eubacteriales bacterium]MDD4474380.1 AAA family ATPase [Eubacteriales bacterium]